MFTAAAIQIISSSNIEENLQRIEFWVTKASQQGASLAVIPENFAHLGVTNARAVGEAEESSMHMQTFLSQLAKRHRIAIVGGTLPRVRNGEGKALEAKVYAACHCYSESGAFIGRYDKVHLFDATVADSQSTYSESTQYAHGEKLGVIPWEACPLGVAVCYDLRFPEYFRHLADNGVGVTAVPAAFTEVTGQAHWHVLLRARAIENQMFIIASNQGGAHDENRVTYGHSCIIDPWGRVLDEISTGEGIAIAPIDLDIRTQLQSKMPVLAHRSMWNKNQN